MSNYDNFVINNGVVEKYLYEYECEWVVIPNGLKAIGDYAFLCCETVKYVYLPESIERIGKYAFSKFTSLEGIHILGNLKSVGINAFEGCTGLKWVNIANPGAWCETVFENAEANPLSLNVPLFINEKLADNIVIPEGVTSVGKFAFKGLSSVKSVTLPAGLRTIDSKAFAECRFLKSVSIPEGVVSIGSFAFDSCFNLRQLTIPDSVTTIGSGAFRSCYGCGCVTVPETVKDVGCNAFSCTVYFQGRALDDVLRLCNPQRALFGFVMNYENDSVSDEIINSYAGYFNKEKYGIGFGIIAGNRALLRFAVKCKETVLSPADAEALLELSVTRIIRTTP